MNDLPQAISASALTSHLESIVGAEGISTEVPHLEYLAHDVYRSGGRPLAALRPRSVTSLQQAVAACCAAGVAMVPRGGGASYTDGYLYGPGGHVVFDLGALDSIEIDESRSYVTVGAGVTWAALKERLDTLGLRTPFWGPFSGLAATVAGSVSQNAISHGSGGYGISAQSVLSMDVVLASGELIHTGASNATRHFGPDLTGLFTGDCGALGIKAAVRLPLIAARRDFIAVSFAYKDFSSFHAGLKCAAAEGLDDEHFGLDIALSQGQIGKQEEIGSRLRIARDVFRSSPNVISGISQLIRMALAGDEVLGSGAYMCHFIIEGASPAEAKEKAARLRTIMASYGSEIANTVPAFVRACPFAPLTNTLGPRGERWVPLHGVLAHDKAVGFNQAFQDFLAKRRPEMEKLGIWTGTMFCSVGSTGLLYEIALYWPGCQTTYHDKVIDPAYLQALPQHADSPEASRYVDQLKRDLISLYADHGAAHFQIGRAYPYLNRIDPQAQVLLKGVKSVLDPKNLMNPGALGLGIPS